MKHRKNKNQSYNTLLVLGLLVLSVSLIWKRHELKKLSFAPTSTYAQQLTELSKQPSHISIDSIGVNLSVGPTVIHEGIWTVNENGVSYLSDSAVPGNNGNVILYAHNTEDRFGNLQKVNADDIVIITTKEGKKYIYRIISKSIVSPSAVEILQPSHPQELTIYTCHGFADLQRLVVKAVPVQI